MVPYGHNFTNVLDIHRKTLDHCGQDMLYLEFPSICVLIIVLPTDYIKNIEASINIPATQNTGSFMVPNRVLVHYKNQQITDNFVHFFINCQSLNSVKF